MDIDHVHFYVGDAAVSRDWFVQTLGFAAIATHTSSHTHTEVVQNGPVRFALSSPVTGESPIASYLQCHPPGIADVAFRVPNLDLVLASAIQAGVDVLQPIQPSPKGKDHLKWAQIQGWGELRHTLMEKTAISIDIDPSIDPSIDSLAMEPDIEPSGFNNGFNPRDIAPLVRSLEADTSNWDPLALQFYDPQLHDPQQALPLGLMGIDHVVLNVGAGELTAAVAWYERVLGFQCQQAFAIQTERSGLCSQVLIHPEGSVQFPINEPTSTNSQIQEFLDHNRGAGIQHIALKTQDILKTHAQLRTLGLQFLSVPQAYYDDLEQRPGFRPGAVDWGAIAAQEILVDWQSDNPEAMLLQTFTQPIFEVPTFFFELIERHTYQQNQSSQQTTGFGEGNFQALFEAMEREQLKRHLPEPLPVRNHATGHQRFFLQKSL